MDTPAKYAKVIAAIGAACDAMGECPEYCYPDTETKTDDGVTDTLGNCIDKGTYAGFKQMIDDMPVYEKSGTNGRFTAGDPGPALCKAITDATCAAAAVGGAKPKTCPEELFLMQADPSTIKHAADAKAKADAEAKEAGADEAKFTKEESDLTAKAAKLKEASEKLRDAATAANQKAASDAAANAADTMKKAQAAAAATAKAEAAGAKFQAEMKTLQADLAKQDGDAAAATKARIAKVEAELKANDEAKAKAEADGKDAAAALKKSGEDLAAEKKKILDDYNSKTAAMGAKLKADTAKLDADHKAMEDKFDKMDMDNAAKAKAAADKAALDATREGTKKDFEKKAAAAQASYDAKMAHAATLKKAADEAAEAAAASVAKSKVDQAAADKAANAADAHAAEDTECAIDGSECRAEDGSCKKISDKGPYLGDDYVSWSDKPGDHGGEYGGEAWMGADNAPAAVVPEEPSDECKKLLAANADAAAAISKSNGDCPVVELACGDDDGKLGDDKDTPAKYAKVIAAIGAACDAMGECPEYYYPDTETK